MTDTKKNVDVLSLQRLNAELIETIEQQQQTIEHLREELNLYHPLQSQLDTRQRPISSVPRERLQAFEEISVNCFVAIPTGRSSGTPAQASKVVNRSP